MSNAYRLIIVFVCVVLSSCVQQINEERVDWHRGARYGRVLEMVTAQEGDLAAHDCLGANKPSESSQQFARVHYRGSRLPHNVVALVPYGLDLRPGDEVELWPSECSEGRMARVGRKLLPAAQAN